MRVTLLVLFTLSAQPMLAQAERIYRCPQLNAPPLFSGTPCASAHQIAPVITNGYQPPRLTPAEQQQLRVLNQKLGRQADSRQRTNRRSKSARSRKAHALLSKENSKRDFKGGSKAGSTTSATTACERHQEALHALKNRRRKGYKLSEAARLEQQEQRLRQNIRLHC
jgi:hypothetical protein